MRATRRKVCHRSWPLFVVIPCASVPGVKAKFTLSTSAGKLEAVKNPYRFTHYSGKWAKDNFGGDKKSKEFSRNKSFFFQSQKKGTITFVLGRKAEKDFQSKIGFYVTKASEGATQVLSVTKDNLVLESPDESGKEVSISKQLEPGIYGITPFVLQSGQHAEYDLLLLSKHELTNLSDDESDRTKVKRTRTGSLQAKNKTLTQEKRSRTRRTDRGTVNDKHEEKAAEDIGKVKLQEQLEKIAELEARLKETRDQNTNERKAWQKAQLLLQDTSEKLRADNKKLIADLNHHKQQKNDREDKLWEQIDDLKSQISQYELKISQEEDGINWTQPIVTTPKKGDNVSIFGEWKGNTAGGCLNHLTWRHNPQIFLTVSQNTPITFTLYQPKPSPNSSPKTISFYVIKTTSPHRKRLVLPIHEEKIVCEGYFSSTKPTKVTAEATLAQSPNPYIIIPTTYLPNDESKWCMNIKSKASVDAVLINPQTDEWPTYQGEWKGPTAGGCTNFRTFVDNPQYLIEVKTHAILVFFLFQEQKPQETFDTISIFVLRSKPGLQQNLYEYKTSTEVKRANFTHANEVTLEAELSPGEYVIVPCTFNPGNEAKFQLKVITKVETAIPPLKLLPKPNWVSVKGEWNVQTAGGTINNKATWAKNAQYALHVKKSLILDVLLTQHKESDFFGIGFIIFDSDGKLVETLDGANIMHKGQYRPDRQVHEEISFAGPKSYTIVPTTFHPHEQCGFSLDITSPTDHTFTEHVRFQKV